MQQPEQTKESEQKKLPSTPEESVEYLQKAKEAGEREKAAEAEPIGGEPEQAEEEKVEQAREAAEEAAGVAAEAESGQEMTKAFEQETPEVEGARIKNTYRKIKDKMKKFFTERIPPDFKKGRLGKAADYFIGAGLAPLAYGTAAVSVAFKALKILFWDHWLSKYFGGIASLFKGTEKKK